MMESLNNPSAEGNGTKSLTREARENFLLCDRVHLPIEPPEMILDNLWPARTIGLFTGDGGVGKTHFTLQLLVAIASGGEVEGTPFRCPKARPGVYITQEDEADFIRGELVCQCPELKIQPVRT
ncbi:MAG: AAA family ATPase, partial [Nitrososphaerales archaeon]